MTASPHSSAPPTTSGSTAEGLPMSAALRVLMGVGFLAVGIVQGVGALTADEVAGAAALLDGVAAFLMAGTGLTMLMNRTYSLYLLLVWAVLGIVTSFLGDAGTPGIASLIARVMVGLVAVVALAQRGSQMQAMGR